MSDEQNNTFNLDPQFRLSLNPEQLAALEKIERLTELDPEVTAKLARALDRLQQTRPYQQLAGPGAPGQPVGPQPAPSPALTPAEQAARDQFVSHELGTLLAVAGQLTHKLESNRLQAQPDRHFREKLRARFTTHSK